MLVEAELFPNLNKQDFDEAISELKVRHNYDESDIHHKRENRHLDSITKELLQSVDLSSSEDSLS